MAQRRLLELHQWASEVLTARGDVLSGAEALDLGCGQSPAAPAGSHGVVGRTPCIHMPHALHASWPPPLPSPSAAADVDEQSKNEIKDILLTYDRTLLVADPRRCEPKKVRAGWGMWGGSGMVFVNLACLFSLV